MSKKQGNPAIWCAHQLLSWWPSDLAFPRIGSQSFPFTLEEIKEFGLVNVWFDLKGFIFPEGIPSEAIAVDYEWLVEESPNPIIGTAISIEGDQYFWLDDRLLLDTKDPNYAIQKGKLCSVGPTVKLAICHNIAADRPRTLESYTKSSDELLWFDTSAVHLILCGVGSQQSWAFKVEEDNQPYFTEGGSLKNLLDVYNFHCSNHKDFKPLLAESKAIRNIFFKGSLADVQNSFADLMDYSLRDPLIVAHMVTELYAKYLDATPSDASRYALFIRGQVNMKPIPDLSRWFNTVESEYQSRLLLLNDLINKISQQKIKTFIAGLKAVAFDLQTLESLVPKNSVLRKKDGKFKNNVLKSGSAVDLVYHSLNLEFNEQYKSICDQWSKNYGAKNWSLIDKWLPEILTEGFTIKSANAQSLCDFQIKTSGHPKGTKIFYGRSIGFYFLTADGLKQKVTSPKKGPKTLDNCGSLLGKDFVDLFETSVIFSENEKADQVCQLATEISYWTSVRKRLALIAEFQTISDLDHVFLEK